MLWVHIDVAKGQDQIMDCVAALDVKQLLLDGCVALFDDSEFIVMGILDYVRDQLMKDV
jgi:hypothetical protein